MGFNSGFKGLMPIDCTISFNNSLREIMFSFTRRPVSLQL